MKQQGWISIHRKLLDNPISSKPDYLSVWITLLLLANHQDQSFIWNNQKQICKRGQVLTGRKELSKKTGVNESKVERILKYLESEQQIEQQTNNRFRLVTIKNYNSYQEGEQQIEQQVNNKRTTSEQQVNTNNNDNNSNNENNVNKNISKDIQAEPENVDSEIINNSLEVQEEKEKSSAKKEKEHEAQISTESDLDYQDGITIEKEPKTSDKPSYGNEDINRMLGTIKGLLYLDDFKETRKLQRQYGLHLVNLKNKLGKEEFASRFMELAHDEFHLKNMGSLKYVYTQIKGFVPIKKETSNIATII